MIIAEKQLKIPGKIYQLEIHCVSTQRPTTMEWLILTCVDRFGDSPRMKDETLKYAFEEVFRIPNSQILIRPPLKHLRELGVIEVNPDIKNYGDLQFGDIRLSQLGRQMLREGAVPGQERTLALTLHYNPLTGQMNEIERSKESQMEQIPFGKKADYSQEFPRERILRALQRGEVGNENFSASKLRITQIECREESPWPNCYTTITLREEGGILKTQPEILEERLKEKIGLLFLTKEMNREMVKELPPLPGEEISRLIGSGSWITKALGDVLRGADTACMDEKLYQCFEGRWDFSFPKVLILFGASSFGVKDLGGRALLLLPEGIISIGADIFGKLQNLKELSLPHSLKAIRSSWGTIVRKNKIKQLTLHENLSWMGIKLKDSMEHLESLDLSAAALTSIPYDMASECKNLVSVKLPAGLKEIRWEAFAACEQLKEVEIPDSVVEIGVQAFMGCKELEKVTLPAGLESIGEDAFAYCPKLSRPKLGEKLAKQAQEEGEVFWGKIGFGDENGCVVKDGVLLKYLGDPKHVVISEGVRVIPESLDRLDRASYLGSYIKTLRLPDSLELFEEGRAFKDVIYGLSVNLPPKYLQTKEKLPSAWTVKLIEGPWKDQVQLKDWAALYLFQSGKRLMELCEKALEAEPEQAVVCFKELLEDGAKPSQKKKAEAFALKYQVSMSQPEVQKEGKDSKTLEPDENGCVVKNGVLVEYRGDRIHAVISEGVRVILKDVLPDDADKTSFSSLQKTYKNSMRSCHLPESLEKIEYQSAFAVDTEVSLPSRYLQTRERLNGFSLEMVMEPFYAKHGWGKLATIKDYAAMYLFQPGKKVQKFCLEKLEGQPDETVRAFGALLSEGAKSSQAMSAAQFAVNHREKVSEEGFQSLLAALSEDPRLKEAAALVAPFAHKGSEEGQQAVQDQLTDQVFKKLGGEDKYLEEVKLLDGRAAPAALVKRAIVPYLELLKEKPQYISGYKEDYLPVQILKEADEEAEKLEKKSFQDALEKLFDAQRRTYRPSRWNGLKRATKTGENSPWMYPYARYGSGAQIAALITDMNQWDNWDVFSASGRKDIIIARSALMLSDTREAILKLDKDKVLDVYADMRNTTADAIRDQQLSDFGLDAKGQKTYGLGTKTIIVSLEKDLTLSLYDTEAQKTVKSIPKKGADPQLAAKAAEDLAEMKKNLKKTAKARSSKLFEEFLTGKTRPAIQWMDIYLKNPLLRQVAQLVVWNQGTDTFTLMADGAAIDCDGAPYEIDRGAAIGVAHPMEMTSGQVKKWRDYFVSEKLKQPFAQVWEPAIDPGSIRPDMYASWELPYYRFMNQDQHGIHEHHNFYSNEWNVWCDDCEVWVDRNAALQSIEDMVVVKEIRFRTYTRKVNHIIAYLDKIAFIGRVLRDDASIGSSLEVFTQAQIMEFITAAMENHCVNSLAVLMDYKNRTFGEEDPMKEFTLE